MSEQPSNVHLKVISERMEKVEIREEQAGFGEGRESEDQIINIRNTVEKRRT